MQRAGGAEDGAHRPNNFTLMDAVLMYGPMPAMDSLKSSVVRTSLGSISATDSPNVPGEKPPAYIANARGRVGDGTGPGATPALYANSQSPVISGERVGAAVGLLASRLSSSSLMTARFFPLASSIFSCSFTSVATAARTATGEPRTAPAAALERQRRGAPKCAAREGGLARGAGLRRPARRGPAGCCARVAARLACTHSLAIIVADGKETGALRVLGGVSCRLCSCWRQRGCRKF